MESESMNALRMLLKSDSYQRASSLPISSEELLRSQQAEKTWSKQNRLAGLRKSLYILLLGILIINLINIVFAPKELYGSVPNYQYYTLVAISYLLNLALCWYVFLKSFKTFQKSRLSLLEQYFKKNNLVFYEKIKLINVDALVNLEKHIEASEKADVDSLFEFSRALLEGKYIKTNYKIAIALASIAADLGHGRSAYIVAQAFNGDLDVNFESKEEYYNYLSFKKDKDSYIFWLEKAKELGSYKAKIELDKMNILSQSGGLSTTDIVKFAIEKN